MKAGNALTHLFLCVILLVALASLLVAYPSRPGVSSPALLIDPQCPGGKPPPCPNTPKANPRPKQNRRPIVALRLKSITNAVGMMFVWLAPESFMMGSEKWDEHQKPIHRVTIQKGYYIGKYEVTQKQWQKVMKSNPSKFVGDNLPVERVTWEAVVEFIRRLNAMNDRYVYKLPTEAEWEYASRAGTTGDYADDVDSMAWYEANSGGQTHPVGLKQPNAFGLYDMRGNVWEMCEDGYHNDYVGAPADGSAWLGADERKMWRGGSYADGKEYCSSTSRIGPLSELFSSGEMGNRFGLRVVAVPQP